MNFSVFLEYGAILLLILLNGFFSGSEIAMISVRKTRLDTLIDQGNPLALKLKQLREDPDRFFATLQIGITVVSVLASTLGGASVVASLTPVLQKVPFAPIAQNAAEVALALVVTVISYLSLVLGELIPKSLGLRYAERWALLATWPIHFLSRVSRPVVQFLTASSNLLLRPLNDQTTFSETRLSREELLALVEDSTKSGAIAPTHGEMLNRAIEFPELRVRDIAVPYTEMVTLDIDSTPAQLKEVLLRRGHSRLPVTRGNRDNVVGWVAARDILQQLLLEQPLTLEPLLHSPYFVPASARVEVLLKDLQARHLHLAIVVDEFGGVQGIATMEDIVERLVGEIYDERASGPRWQKLADHAFLVPGSMTLSDLSALTGLNPPTVPHVYTVGGLLLHELERVPQVDERIEMEGVLYRVTDRSDRSVKWVEVTIPKGAQAPPPPETSDTGA